MAVVLTECCKMHSVVVCDDRTEMYSNCYVTWLSPDVSAVVNSSLVYLHI